MSKKQSLMDSKKYSYNVATDKKKVAVGLTNQNDWPNLQHSKQKKIVAEKLLNNVEDCNVSGQFKIKKVDTILKNKQSTELEVDKQSFLNKINNGGTRFDILKNNSENFKDDNGWIKIQRSKKQPSATSTVTETLKENKLARNKKYNHEMKGKSNLKTDLAAYQESKSEVKITDEERKKSRELRKQRIKDEKKRKREEKARILRESLRRDTKISVVSQEVIESWQKKSLPTNSYGKSLPQQQNNFQNIPEEYPSLDLSFKKTNPRSTKKNLHALINSSETRIWSNIPKSKTSLSETKDQKQFNSPSITSTGTGTCASTASDNIAIKLSDDANTEINKNKVSTERKVSYSSAASNKVPAVKFIKNDPLKQKSVNVPLPVAKKKVKSTDGIQLDFEALLQAKKNKKKPKSSENLIKKKTSKVVIEKHHGKKREGKPKKLSSLRKNIVREKKKQAEMLLKLLKERQQEIQASNIDSTQTLLSDTGICATKITDQEESQKSSEVLSSDASLIVEEIKVLMNPVHNRKFREYCHHILTPEIDEVLKELIQLLVKFQDRLYKSDPIKAKMKRRYYCGLKEAFKHMNKLSCLIMAPNLKPSPGTGCVDELVSKVLSRAEDAGVPVMFGLSHRMLGRLCFKKVPISCFAIVNYQGAQEKFHRLMELVPEAKKQYEKLVSTRPLPESLDNEDLPLQIEEETPTSNPNLNLLQALKS